VTELVRFLVQGVVRHPEAVVITAHEGDASVVIELQVDPSDLARVNGPDGDTLRAIRQVLSASAGQRKAILELVQPGTDVADALASEPEADTDER
jgi:predicted RNA-binding protein YlqC (UPF0109 family)